MATSNTKPSPTNRTSEFSAFASVTLAVAILITLGCEKKKGLDSKAIAPTTVNQSRAAFRDVSTELRLEQKYDNGESAGERAILETIGGGIAAADFDRDGFDDLFFASGGLLNDKKVSGGGGRLWRNRQGHAFVDVSQPSMATPDHLYTHATVSGDLNHDGFPDYLITGYQGLALYMNQGDGTFLEQSALAGLTDTTWGTSAAFGDFDSDGSLDMYIAHYVDWSFENHPACKSGGVPDVCAPGIFTGHTDLIYLSDGQGSYAGRSTEMGLEPEGKGLGVLVADFNQDSRVDIYVANDTTNNFFYRNAGDRLEEIGMASGTAVNGMGTPEGSMGLCTFDYDGDLLNDIWVCNYENQAFALYKNDGDCGFRYVTATAGLSALGTTYVAWGTAAFDYDLDGDEDIVVANGHVMRGNDPAQLPLYLENAGNKKFQSITFSKDNYFSTKWRGRGVVAFDLERDGDIDLAFSHIDQDAVILANETRSDGNWWMLDLVGTKSNRDAIGARVVIESDRRKIVRNIVGGGSYLSQNPYLVHWGFPPGESVKSVSITWPSGTVQTIGDIVPRTRTLVVETVDQ